MVRKPRNDLLLRAGVRSCGNPADTLLFLRGVQLLHRTYPLTSTNKLLLFLPFPSLLIAILHSTGCETKCVRSTSAAGAKPSTGAASGSVTVGGGRPSLTEECVDKPGPGGHWCYRMQQYVIGKSGDYLYNVSQNVPSLPMPWKPWCASFKNCAMVLPLAAVPIPITGGHECNPSKTCNVCAACCQSYIPDGSKCDGCVASECK